MASFDVEERILSSWSVSAVLFSRKVTVKKHPCIRRDIRVRIMQDGKGERKRSFTLYRSEIFRLLNHPKNARDQLIIELPCLMGFRTHEIATWRKENIHFATGDTEVLDAKKHRLFTVPLNFQVAKHVEEALNGHGEGYVIENTSRSCRGRKTPLTDTSLWYVWQKYAKQLGLFPSHRDYSPIVGRRFFAAEWFYTQRLSLATLSKIMRHNDIETTLRYVSQLIFYEDVRRDYDKFQFKVMEDMEKQKMEMMKV